MMFMVLIILILSSILILMTMLVSFKMKFNRDSFSPFECGFDPYHTSRIPFSLQFFLITVIFLIFDVEIAILLPLPISQLMNYPSSYLLIVFVFLMVLIGGTYYEWNKGGLTWYF